ncbi:RelA/SpoT domain-containing protein [Oceanibaculum pacificum]|uniref:RelA/SpoT domain-containing protein n=1 Tax=Oceanibaculum pacificum TaxID=580166 RepID=UPI0018DB1427|nr:RelA/SpoT domain-containing protein [Oceanibaculum pacificum]
MISKNKIDKAGQILSSEYTGYDENILEMEYYFDEYRKSHLTPLTRLTLEVQEWLRSYNRHYFIAQRLKRKPQIIRKLKRFSVRLTQLQDIGGCRVIVENNSDVDNVVLFIVKKINESNFAKIIKETDYRDFGRDDTGYRAYHIIISINGLKLEIQVRSKIQHYWSESIERTSVIYGYRLKEKDGHFDVISYFKEFSNFYIS